MPHKFGISSPKGNLSHTTSLVRLLCCTRGLLIHHTISIYTSDIYIYLYMFSIFWEFPTFLSSDPTLT